MTPNFDPKFANCRGWNQLRDEDLDLLWEHWVLNEMHSHIQLPSVRYWRDKRGHEVDFILIPRGKNVGDIQN
jgi:predicted AAA+ superfamily ATPase